MATIDHLILYVNEMAASVDFKVNVLGFELEGEDPNTNSNLRLSS